MNAELTKELLSRLDALAAKLGIAADQLWAILVRQAHIEANIDFGLGLVTFVIFLAAVVVFVYGVKRGTKMNREQWDCASSVCTVLGGGIIPFAFGIAVAFWLDAYRIAMNPEYWAFKELAKLLGR